MLCMRDSDATRARRAPPAPHRHTPIACRARSRLPPQPTGEVCAQRRRSPIAMAAAQSLQCDICGAKLRSVAEAEAHGEATGHAAFSESTEAVRRRRQWRRGAAAGSARAAPHPPHPQVARLVCTECGKVCRSETERDLHTMRTGHAGFEDKVRACVCGRGGGCRSPPHRPTHPPAPSCSHTDFRGWRHRHRSPDACRARRCRRRRGRRGRGRCRGGRGRGGAAGDGGARGEPRAAQAGGWVGGWVGAWVGGVGGWVGR